MSGARIVRIELAAGTGDLDLAAHDASGARVAVSQGTGASEQVAVPGSGVSGNPFVIQALGSPVLVDGSDDFSSPALWTLLSGNVYRAASVTWSPLQVFEDGARLTISTGSPASLPSNSFVYVSGQGLYVNVGGGNPGSHALLVGHRSFGFQLVGRAWITLAGFQVAHTESRGIYLNSPNNPTGAGADQPGCRCSATTVV